MQSCHIAGVKAVKELALCLITAAVFGYIVLQWVSGCGETYIDSQGIRHEYSCK